VPNKDLLNRQFMSDLQERIRDKNCAIIDPLIPDLTLEAFDDLIEATAKVRGAYIKQYFKIAKKTQDELPKAQDLQKLQGMREIYEEMSAAHRALEAAIEHGHLTVKV